MVFHLSFVIVREKRKGSPVRESSHIRRVFEEDSHPEGSTVGKRVKKREKKQNKGKDVLKSSDRSLNGPLVVTTMVKLSKCQHFLGYHGHLVAITPVYGNY